MDAAVTALASDSGPLFHVSGQLVPQGRFHELAFEFDKGTLLLRCDDDTDEIVLETTNPPARRDGSKTLLSELIGMQIDYAWELRNHRGYMDAIQLRLTAADGREATCQFEAAASAMDIRRVVAT
jgi:hypothetical protein